VTVMPSMENAPAYTNGRADELIRSGRSREARELLSGSLPSIERRGDRAALRQAVNLLGAASFETGELGDAEVAFNRALELGRSDNDDLLVARATNNLGAIANVRGEREQAIAMYSLAIAAYQRLGQPRGLASAYHNMAITFRHIGLLERADEYERRAIEFAMEAENPHILSLARIGRAELSLLRGDARLAEATALLVAREFASRSDPHQQANALRVVGAARTALGDLDGARRALDEGLTLAREHSAALAEAELLRARAELNCWLHDRAAARADATEAIRIFDRLAAREDSDKLARWLAAVEQQVNGQC
jgi:tetratricopeptide (TPR) repeat protein